MLDGVLVDEAESSPEGDREKGAENADMGGDGVVAKGADQETA